jgi:hypothetical protein
MSGNLRIIMKNMKHNDSDTFNVYLMIILIKFNNFFKEKYEEMQKSKLS